TPDVLGRFVCSPAAVALPLVVGPRSLECPLDRDTSPAALSPPLVAGLSWLPTYAPELNSLEQGWNYTKDSELANYLPGTLEQLHDPVGFSLPTKRYHPALLPSCFHYARLRL